MTDLFSKAATGLKWTSFSSLGISLSQFTLGVFLARLLSPVEFGLVAMVTVIIGYASILVDFGLGSVLIQKSEVSENEYSAVFWLNMLISVLIAIMMIIFAGRIADFYDQPVVARITCFLSPILLFNAWGLCYRARLEREIDLRPVSVAEMASVILSSLLAIGLALMGYGVWSLVAMYLIRALLYNAIIIMSADWHPNLRFDLKGLSPLFVFSGTILTNRMAEGAAGSMDRLLVGKVSGSEDLGIYEKAKNLMLMPTMMVAGIISRVALPSLSRMQEDTVRFSAGYERMLGLISFVVFPMIFGLHLIAPDLIPFLLGHQWSAMVPVFQIICGAGLFTVANILTDNVIVSSGNQRGLMKLTFIEKPFMVAIFFFGIIWGVTGVAYAYVIGSVITFLYKTYIATGPLVVSPLNIYSKMILPLFGSVIMYLSGFILLKAGLGDAHVATRLTMAILTGVLVYYVMARLTQRSNFDYFIRIVHEFRK